VPPDRIHRSKISRGPGALALHDLAFRLHRIAEEVLDDGAD
jgi:hypothetical protein